MTKIMLVEDDKSLREIYGIRLIAEGYEIKSAGDGEEALAMAIKEKPDLVISDVMMPKISGFDMLDILRATPETKDIKVIMMTALSSEDQRSRGESLGANKYLVKSQVGIEDVIRTVHEVLGDAPVAAPVAPSFGPLAPSSSPTPKPQAAPSPAPTPQPSVAPAPTPVVAPVAPQTSPTVPIKQQTMEPVMPQPTAPFSSPAPASLGDTIVSQPQTPVAVAPTPQPSVAPAPTPVVAPVAPQTSPTAPIQDVLPPQPAPQAPASVPTTDSSLSNIADMIAKELGSTQASPQIPNQPQA